MLRTLERWAPLIPTYRWPLLEALARVRLEDWSGASAVLENRFQRPNLMLLSPLAYDFLRALICSHLGRVDEAGAYYARGMVEWERETVGDSVVWENSDAMRWRRAAEAVLPK